MPFWFFLSPAELQQQGNIILSGSIFAHLKAARLKPGDDIVLSDGQGKAYAARFLSFEPQRQTANATILHKLHQNTEPPLAVTLFLGITKGEKMDQAIRQSVELGVKKIVPVLTERTVVKLNGKKGEMKHFRWQNIAFAAAAQSHRSFVPEISKPLEFRAMAALLSGEKLVLVPWEKENERGLLKLVAKINPPPTTVSIFTGPEGGIAPGEMEILKKLPCVYPLTLGPRILRAETAPLAVLAVLMCFWGDLGRFPG